jgi:exodeoxyribonuclease VII large subunit
MTRRKQRLADLSRALPRPDSLIMHAQQRLDVWEGRLPLALRSLVQRQQLRLGAAAAQVKPSTLRRVLNHESRQLQMLGTRLPLALGRRALSARLMLSASAARLRPAPLVERTQRLRKELDDLNLWLTQIFSRQISERQQYLQATDRLRETLGYRETLSRGYAVVRAGEALITGVAGAKKAKYLEIEFADGRFPVGQSSAVGSIKPPKSKPPEQGQLF